MDFATSAEGLGCLFRSQKGKDGGRCRDRAPFRPRHAGGIQHGVTEPGMKEIVVGVGLGRDGVLQDEDTEENAASNPVQML